MSLLPALAILYLPHQSFLRQQTRGRTASQSSRSQTPQSLGHSFLLQQLSSASVKREGCPPKYKRQATRLVLRLSQNGYGLMAQKIKEGDSEDELIEAFKVFDRDNDGYINAEE
mmetsp:Transcript_11696/g.16729  ORF Transcript_11696/g.16729 Transcript_11696/m.16729 type:complete len:114 (-) Transcript_11696:154-495(-)